MAGWRQAIDLAMTDEEIASLRTISRSRTELARRVERAQMLLAYRENPSFFAVGRSLGVHHQKVERCVERALADGPLAALDDRPHPGREPTITPQRPRPGWCLWDATRPRITAIRTSCGQHGSWPAMRGSTARRWGTTVSPSWHRARCARYSATRKSSRTRWATIWNVVTSSSSRRWPTFCASIARSKS